MLRSLVGSEMCIRDRCSLCRLPVTKNRNFLANFDIFRSSSTDPLLTIRVKFGVLEQTKGLHLPAKSHLNVFIVSAPCGQKPQFWANFDTFERSCSFRLVPKSVTLNDLERRNGVRCCRKTINRPTSVSESTFNTL